MYFKNDNELFKTIGNNIQYFRKNANLTQSQLAEEVGISLSYLYKSISISVLNQIANCLNVDIIEFLKEE